MNLHSRPVNRSLIAGLCAFALAMPRATASEPGTPAEYEAARRGIDQTFAKELAELAARCDQWGLEQAAAVTRQWQLPRPTDRQLLYLGPTAAAPDDTDTEPSRGDTSADSASLAQQRQAWHEQFQDVRAAQADRLWQLAEARAAVGDYDHAYRLLYELVREMPEHPDARRHIGSEAGQGSGRVRSRVGRGRHPEYRWPPGSYWVIDSDHYRVLTSADQAAGIRLAQQLETLHTVWRQLFLRYWAPDATLERSWKTHRPFPAPTAKFQVVLFADRNEYIEYLKRFEPQIHLSLGVYRHTQRTAFFYAGGDDLMATWMHEATHQLFHQAVRVGRDVGEQRDFWMVEAVALYMESLVAQSDHCLVGGWDADRLQFARYRALMEEFYVPVDRLSLLGRVPLQRHPELRRIYSQAAGLAHFLFDGQQGQYRRGSLEYLVDIYQGRPQAAQWPDHLGVPAAELDTQYRAFLGVSDQALLRMARPERVARLSLGRTEVTDGGLVALKDCERLEWLDVSFCDVSNEGLAHLHPGAPLRQLSLQHTRVTDDVLTKIAQYPSLEELDLSGTQVTDTALREIAKLRQLRLLWLTGTQITDAGLNQLVPLDKLEVLDVEGTAVSPAAWQRVRGELPNLRAQR